VKFGCVVPEICSRTLIEILRFPISGVEKNLERVDNFSLFCNNTIMARLLAISVQIRQLRVSIYLIITNVGECVDAIRYTLTLYTIKVSIAYVM